MHNFTNNLKAALLLGAILLLGWATAVAMSQVAPVELTPDDSGQINGPISAGAAHLPEERGMVRVTCGGSTESNSRVRVSLSIQAEQDDSIRALRVPVALDELSPRASDSRRSWSVTFDISPELASRSVVEVYIERVGGPSDTGKWYRFKVGELLPPPDPPPQPPEPDADGPGPNDPDPPLPDPDMKPLCQRLHPSGEACRRGSGGGG